MPLTPKCYACSDIHTRFDDSIGRQNLVGLKRDRKGSEEWVESSRYTNRRLRKVLRSTKHSAAAGDVEVGVSFRIQVNNGIQRGGKYLQRSTGHANITQRRAVDAHGVITYIQIDPNLG